MKITVNRTKVHNLTQFELAQLMCRILDLLDHRHPSSENPYTNGWDDSRKSIINVLMLREYYEKES